MFLAFDVALSLVSSFPRVRGDVPRTKEIGTATPTFSPRARGCSGAVCC